MIKNQYILKTVSLFLSFWMLLASTGMSIDVHYCDGELMDWSVLSDAECDHNTKQEVKSCCEVKTHSSCSNLMQDEFVKSSCCNSFEASMELGSEFDYNSQVVTYSLPQLLFVASLIYSVETDESIENKDIFYETPVIFYENTAPFIQSFLI